MLPEPLPRRRSRTFAGAVEVAFEWTYSTQPSWPTVGFSQVRLPAASYSLARIVKREKMAWPQYFETRSEEHRIGEKLGIESIPTMWLIDKEGNLRDLDARHNLAGRVEKLLAEK
jgi:hypothetical protein